MALNSPAGYAGAIHRGHTDHHAHCHASGKTRKWSRSGTDDYVVKPFSPRELLAEYAVMRRSSRRTLKTNFAEDLSGHDIPAGEPQGNYIHLGPRNIGCWNSS
jgi:hypothetical protein